LAILVNNLTLEEREKMGVFQSRNGCCNETCEKNAAAVVALTGIRGVFGTLLKKPTLEFGKGVIGAAAAAIPTDPFIIIAGC
jgi:hypothetical protein